MRLDGKVALVTGGSRGIGRAICLRFASEGASVIVNFTTGGAKAESVVAEIVQAGGRALAPQAEVASTAAVESQADAAAKQFGRIDILVNNAGILRAGKYTHAQ